MRAHFTLVISILLLFATSLSAQITREQADAVVLEHIQKEVVLPYLLYVNVNLPNDEGIALTTYNEENMKVKYACWAYYLNENPEVSEPARHRYLFVKENDGNLLEVITYNDLGPADLTQWELMSLGVNEGERSDIRIYPNPTMGEFKVQGFKSSRVQNVEIFDMMGRKIPLRHSERSEESRTKRIVAGLGSEKEWQPQADGVVLNISHLSNGIYLIKIATETGIITKKVIKN